MNSGNDIYAALLADSGVTALLNTVGGAPCISVGNKEPESWGADDATISIYQAAVIDHRLEYSDQTWTVNCRAGKYADSQEIAEAVITALNRKSTGIEGLFYCQQLATIQPLDKKDSYNTPVEVQVKRRA